MPSKNKPHPKRTSRNSLSSPSLPEALLDRIRNERLLASRNYVLYLSSLLQKTQIYRFWNRYLGFFRKIRLVSILLRIYSYLLVLLQLGTAFFVIVVGLLLLLPVFLLGALFVVFSALLLYRQENKKLHEVLTGKRIAVFFPTREGEFATGAFWKANVTDTAGQPNTAVLIVSPYFWSGRGLDGKHFYLLLRQETENVYLVRKHYYFSLKRAVLEKNRDLVSLIY